MTRKRCRKLLMSLYDPAFMPRDMLNKMLVDGINAYHSYDIYYLVQHAIYLDLTVWDGPTVIDELEKAHELARKSGYWDAMLHIEKYIAGVKSWYDSYDKHRIWEE